MNIKYIVVIIFLVNILMIGCKSDSFKEPVISFDNYKVADGFEIQLAASEPLIEAPVTMDFDNQGRMWVAEMRSYMPNLDGVGEDTPNGRIVILEDLDGDGTADHVKVFLDSLILPRAIAHAYGGLLYAAPPNLWFVKINDDKPGEKTLVDSMYSVGGNPEEQPNGLLMNIDNWIYNAKSNFRYKLKNGKWIKDPTSFRGQWGIAKDNFGRLYYNYNTVQLVGDYVLPNTTIDNPFLRPRAGLNKVLTNDQHVYPLHPTTVNRGYVKGILNDDSVLVEFTAACGPLIYRGDQFPDGYDQNAFVCEPQGNLVKRDIMDFGNVKTTAKQAWSDREFLASTDEGFRPVNLFNGPDGALYVVDMHRGIMQHRAYETPYYHREMAKKKLDTLLSKGRILRIAYQSKKLSKIPKFNEMTGTELVALLKSPNGWVRDRVQQLLIYREDRSTIPALEALAQNDQQEIPAIHALHTLDGLNALSFNFLKQVAASGNPKVVAHAILLLKQYNSPDNVDAMKELASLIVEKKDSVANLYLAGALGPWAQLAPDTFLPLLAQISKNYAGQALYQEAVISSLNGLENDFRAYLSKTEPITDQNQSLSALLDQTIDNRKSGKKNPVFVRTSVAVDNRTDGLRVFQTICSGCHGLDGTGIENLAPPLNESQYVSGSADRMAMIILNGLEGPIHVGDQLYTFNGVMPAFNNTLSDQEIANVIHYLHNAFVRNAKGIGPDEIKELRAKETGTLTEKDLQEMEKQ